MSAAVRSCAACRERAVQDDLIRLSAVEGRVVPDLKARLPGRGAWVHANAACVAELESRPGKLHKSLGVVEAVGLGDLLRDLLRRAALDGLSQAAAAGALTGGFEVLSGALREGAIVWVVLASDASARTVDGLKGVAGDVPFTTLPLTAEALGTRVGRGLRAALGVRRSRASTHLLRQLRRLRDLG